MGETRRTTIFGTKRRDRWSSETWWELKMFKSYKPSGSQRKRSYGFKTKKYCNSNICNFCTYRTQFRKSSDHWSSPSKTPKKLRWRLGLQMYDHVIHWWPFGLLLWSSTRTQFIRNGDVLTCQKHGVKLSSEVRRRTDEDLKHGENSMIIDS